MALKPIVRNYLTTDTIFDSFGNVREDWRQLKPLVDWLTDHVGPAADPAAGTPP